MEVIHLDLTAHITPETSHLRVEGHATFRDVDDKLAFILNPSLEISTIELVSEDGPAVLDFVETRPPSDLFAPAAHYEVCLPEKNRTEEDVRIRFEYEGKIYRYYFQTSRIREDFVELAIYAVWYPMVDFSDRPSYVLRLHGPDNWTWITNGKRVHQSPLAWQTDGSVTDITLHGRPKKNAIQPEESDLFWGEPRNFEQLKPLEKKFKALQQKLITWLGELGVEDLRIILVPRDFGGGYARRNLIVIQDDVVEQIEEREKAIIEYWGHEFSHFWFMKTTVKDYHNWVDEAFATYASLLAIESIYGKEEFEARIKTFQKRIDEEQDLPSIKSIKRQDPNAQLVYYVYGTLILHEIRRKIGREKFIQFMKNFAQKCLASESIVTEDMIVSLEKSTEQKWGKYLDERLSMAPRGI